jgi:hypothetical protein
MGFFLVGHKLFKKDFSDLLIGSSVVAGNIDSVRDRETKEKGESLQRPFYTFIDNLRLVEVYKGFPVYSNVAERVAYEILYDAVAGEVRGVLVGALEDDGTVSYYAVVPKGTKSVKKHISVLIDVIDFGLIPAVQKEIEEIFNLDEEGIREKFGEPVEKIYAGSFLGSSEKGLILIPFSTYKPKEVIPAYGGEEDGRIEELEGQLAELNEKLSSTAPDSEEHKKLLEEKTALLEELTKLRNRLYNPDILRAIKTKEDKVFITQKPEIRYLGENLINAAYEYKNIRTISGDSARIKGVYAVVTLPVYNNLSGRLQRGYLEVMLTLFDGNELYPVDVQKARQTISILSDTLKELIRAVEGGERPNLSAVKLKVKDNLSLKKRVEDLEKFVLSKEGEELKEVLTFLVELKRELDRGRRILYSPFTVSRLINPFEIVSLLQEAGLDPESLSKEDWNELFAAVEVLNENLENAIKASLSEELKLLAKLFLKKLEAGEPIRYRYKSRGEIVEGHYPAPDRPLKVEDLFPNRVLINIIKGAVAKLNATQKVLKLGELELFFGGKAVRIESPVWTALARKVFSLVAKEILRSADYNREEEIEELKSFLMANWVGEIGKREKGSKTVQDTEVVDIDGLEELLDD